MREAATPPRSFAGRLLREPLLHFLAIGAAVFLLYGRGPERPAQRPETVIEVTPTRVERLAGQFEAVWRRPPTGPELAGLVDDFVREEIYYREALALGLDRDDTVVRRRLRQKMEFLGDAGGGALAPTDAELRAYFAAHADRFALAPRLSFRQVFLGEADARVAGAARDALAAGADPLEVGRGTLLPPGLRDAVESSVDSTFGAGFFQVAVDLPVGTWQGPVASAFGDHLVFVEAAEAGGAPSFESVHGLVEADWRRQAGEDLREAQYQALRARYQVVLQDTPSRE